MKTTSCKNCTQRHTACHSTCPSYKDWHSQYQAHSQKIKKARQKEYELTSYCVSRSDKIKRRYGLNGY